MARVQNPNREEAKKQWLASGGKITLKELAAARGVSQSCIRKWKKDDNWQAALDKPRKRGGQKGNKNAVGHGAPVGNSNAERHGAYSSVHLENLPTEERIYIESLTLETDSLMLRELQTLTAKERDLARKIKAYEKDTQGTLYVDRVIETPNSHTVIKASSFDRQMKLETEYNKLHGRILKLIDSIRAQGIDDKRLDLDERKHNLAKQRLSGEYSIDPETGEIDDTGGSEGMDEDI